MRWLSFLGGFAVGAVLGGAVALLLAPRSGTALRAAMRDEWQNILIETRRAAEQRRRDLEAELAKLRQ